MKEYTISIAFPGMLIAPRIAYNSTSPKSSSNKYFFFITFFFFLLVTHKIPHKTRKVQTFRHKNRIVFVTKSLYILCLRRYIFLTQKGRSDMERPEQSSVYYSNTFPVLVVYRIGRRKYFEL